MSSNAKPTDRDRVNEARRKLLRAGVYAAPAVIATLVASTAEAGPCTPTKPACSCSPSASPNCTVGN